MDIKTAIGNSKTILADTGWHTGKLKKSTFPLSKSKSLKLGAQWEWRATNFEAGDQEFVLLVAFNPLKSIASAHLGMKQGKDTLVLARYEIHATHGTWHAHTRCEDSSIYTPGHTGGNSFRKLSSKYGALPASKEVVYEAVAKKLKLYKQEFGLSG